MRNFENRQKIMKASGVLAFLAGWAIVGCVTQGIVVALAPILSWHSCWFWFKLPYCALECMVWWNLCTFFSRLKGGHFFDIPTVGRLAAAGKYMLAAAVYLYIFDFLLFVIENPAANGFGKLDDETGSLIGNLSTALVVFLMAWLLREGQTLEEEQKLTV